jgi:hypothetical protein
MVEDYAEHCGNRTGQSASRDDAIGWKVAEALRDVYEGEAQSHLLGQECPSHTRDLLSLVAYPPD